MILPIHALSPSDGEWVANLMQENQDGLGVRPYCIKDLQNMLQAPTYQGFGLPFAKGFIFLQGIKEQEAELLVLCVGKGQRKKGFGAQLLLRAQSYYQAIFLEVAQDNLPALAIYQKYGFQKIGLRKNYYAHAEKDAVAMKWTRMIEMDKD